MFCFFFGRRVQQLVNLKHAAMNCKHALITHLTVRSHCRNSFTDNFEILCWLKCPADLPLLGSYRIVYPKYCCLEIIVYFFYSTQKWQILLTICSFTDACLILKTQDTIFFSSFCHVSFITFHKYVRCCEDFERELLN